MPKAVMDVRSLARSHTNMAVKVLASVAQNSTNDSARVAAANSLIDRGWGKAEQHHAVDGQFQVVIRQIVENVSTGEVIDVTPNAPAQLTED